jgi:hypothetical protein
VEVKNMIHMATKMKRQLKKKGHDWPTFNSGSSSSWKLDLRREETTQPKPFIPTKIEPLIVKVEASMSFKGKSNTEPKCTRDVKCFSCQRFGHYALECLNKRIMVIRGNGDVEFESDKLVVKKCHHWRIVLKINWHYLLRSPWL